MPPTTATLRPGPAPHTYADEPAYGYLHTDAAAPLALAEWENPEAVTLALARYGWTLPELDELRPDTDPDTAPAQELAALPATAWTCPPWCATCPSTGPVLVLRADPGNPLRAVLVHSRPLAAVGSEPRGWTLTLTRQVLLSAPTRTGPALIAVTSPTGSSGVLTRAEADGLAGLLRHGSDALAGLEALGPAHDDDERDPWALLAPRPSR